MKAISFNSTEIESSGTRVNQGIGLLCNKLLTTKVIQTQDGKFIGYSYEEILELVKQEKPSCQTTLKCLYYYSKKLRDERKLDGIIRPKVSTDELLRRSYEQEKETKKKETKSTKK